MFNPIDVSSVQCLALDFPTMGSHSSRMRISWTNCHVTFIQRPMINLASLHWAPIYIKGISAYKTRVKHASNLRLKYTAKAQAEIRGRRKLNDIRESKVLCLRKNAVLYSTWHKWGRICNVPFQGTSHISFSSYPASPVKCRARNSWLYMFFISLFTLIPSGLVSYSCTYDL